MSKEYAAVVSYSWRGGDSDVDIENRRFSEIETEIFEE